MLVASHAVQRRNARPILATKKELSGPGWVGRFPGSVSTAVLAPGFRTAVDAFLAAMHAARVRVIISSTYRPAQRSYLMHWCWKIAHGTSPAAVPRLAGVDIEWVHPRPAASLEAARQMVRAFGMDGLHTPPALRSLHNDRNAIDMTISWTGTVTMTDQQGASVQIATLPRTGMNRQLHAIGASYGVMKFVGGDADKPHWSSTGH